MLLAGLRNFSERFLRFDESQDHFKSEPKTLKSLLCTRNTPFPHANTVQRAGVEGVHADFDVLGTLKHTYLCNNIFTRLLGLRAGFVVATTRLGRFSIPFATPSSLLSMSFYRYTVYPPVRSVSNNLHL